MPDQTSTSAVDLRHILGILRRQALIIFGCCGIAVGVAVGLSSQQQKLYTAKASMLFGDPGFSATLFGSSPGPARNPDRVAATNLQLVRLPVIAERTAAAVGQGVTSAEVTAAIDLVPGEKSDVVDVLATDPRRTLSPKIANTFAEQFIDFRRTSDRNQISSAQKTVETQIAALRRRGGASLTRTPGQGESMTPQQTQLANLQGRAEDLRILASLQNGNAELVQRASAPSAPSSPEPKRNALIALFGGLLIGLILGLLREQLDRSIKTPEEAAAAMGAPLVGAIPFGRALGTPAAMPHVLSMSEEESFRMLHTALRLSTAGEDSKVIIVTSAVAAEGKTTVALHLAASACLLGERVLLVDADLRRPRLHEITALPPGPGLPEILAGRCEIEQAIQHVPVAAGSEDGPQLDVLVAGNPPEHRTRVVSSEQIARVILRARGTYDRIIIDTPPATVVSDALTLMQKVPAIVLVVTRIGRATQDSAKQLQRQLAVSGARIEGIVANCVNTSSVSDYYYYSYAVTKQTNGAPPRNTDKKRRAGVGSA
jgi:capsular exopolysaccharide synthesis family protein